MRILKLGNLSKGWVFHLEAHNPTIIRYKESGRLRQLNIFGIIRAHWIVRRVKNEMS